MSATKTLPPHIVEAIHDTMKRDRAESYLIAVLRDVQNHFGYLPRECLDEVSRRMQIPSAKVTGVATFYHLFSFRPKGRCRITVCMGTACFVRGAEAVLERIKELLLIDVGETTPDGAFSIENARCLGACALAPVVLVNERVYGNVTIDQVPGILAEWGGELKRERQTKEGEDEEEADTVGG